MLYKRRTWHKHGAAAPDRGAVYERQEYQTAHRGQVGQGRVLAGVEVTETYQLAYTVGEVVWGRSLWYSSTHLVVTGDAFVYSIGFIRGG